mmetsp:Transcript_114304/g.272045  ORF Transcript_114304/g.272045 Transcript_114304/m.272045 type:complete len:218 (+) Transcript_114304:334-987(+)
MVAVPLVAPAAPSLLRFQVHVPGTSGVPFRSAFPLALLVTAAEVAIPPRGAVAALPATAASHLLPVSVGPKGGPCAIRGIAPVWTILLTSFTLSSSLLLPLRSRPTFPVAVPVIPIPALAVLAAAVAVAVPGSPLLPAPAAAPALLVPVATSLLLLGSFFLLLLPRGALLLGLFGGLSLPRLHHLLLLGALSLLLLGGGLLLGRLFRLLPFLGLGLL